MTDTATVKNGRMLCDATTPVVYVARRNTAILGVYGKVSDAEAAVAAHLEEAGDMRLAYAVDVVPFFGKLWRPGRGESDE